MNDNRPTRDSTLAAMLSASMVIEEHFTKGLRAMLEANAVPCPVLDAIEPFARPALDRLRSAEETVIAFARELSPREQLLATPPEGLVVDAFSVVLKSYAEQFSRLASSPEQMRMAANFDDFTNEITSAMKGREAENGEGTEGERRGPGEVTAMMDDLMTKHEVCKLLRCSSRTLDRWRSVWRSKKVDVGEVKIGRRAKFRRDKIEKMVSTPKLWV